MMRTRAVIAGVLTAVLATGVLAGCSAAEKASPRVALRNAAQATADQKEGSFKLSVVGSEADMNALFNEGAALSEEDRKGLGLLRNGHIALSTGNDTFALDVKAGDVEHAFELRYIDQKLYARADVNRLAELFGASPDDIGQAVSGIASQEGLGFLSAAAAGKWIVADLGALKGLLDNAKQQTGTTGGYQALRDAVGKALAEDTSIKDAGSEDAGQHYVATVTSLRSFYGKIRPAIEQEIGSKLPSAEALPPVDAAPERPASVDVWVKSGRISRLELDLAQFAPTPPAGGGRVALRLDIDREAATVTAPSDAVNVDVAGVLSRLFGQFGNVLEGVGGGAKQVD